MHKAFWEVMDKTVGGTRLIDAELSVAGYLDRSASGMPPFGPIKCPAKRSVPLIRARQVVKNILETANFDKLFTLS